MCSGPKSKVPGVTMDKEANCNKESILRNCSVLLEFAASDDLASFKSQVEERSLDVDQARYWYGRKIGSKKMGFDERTPLMIAAMFGSVDVLKYILGTGKADVNKASGSDNATALHCAVAGATISMFETIKLLVDASADVHSVDALGNKPIDLLVSSKFKSYTKRLVELILKGESVSDKEEEKLLFMPSLVKEGAEKKEYPVDISLPDINNGIYSTDEFRMYSFKVKPCSRAYSHDWTECPFVHPGENARRRDPRKYPYSCVPCPEFRKGTCQKGDACEYAHGVFESWLHPSQYRTRLCKDETGCARKVCFFAHKPDELRPVYASTGSALPSPRPLSASPVDMLTLSPLNLGSPPPSTMAMSPLVNAASPKGGSMWQSRSSLSTPTALQLPGSRLKAALNARDLELKMELLGLENTVNHLQQQQLLEELSGLSSPSRFSRVSDLKPTNLQDVLGSMDPSLMSPLSGLNPTQLQSPTMLQSMSPLRNSYHSATLSSSPARNPSAFGFDSSAAVAAAVMNSRSSAFSKRSQSFVDRSGRLGFTAAANSAAVASPNLSDWSSPDGKLDWGVQGDELNKLKRSASFGFRTQHTAVPGVDHPLLGYGDEPDVSWVNSLVKEVPPSAGMERQYNLGNVGIHEPVPSWIDQMYIEHEQIVA